MPRCQPCSLSYTKKYRNIPHIWLFTDERNDEVLDQAIARLPRGSGIVFRHYHLDSNARAIRLERITGLARRFGHLVLLADTPALARRHRAGGVHGRQWRAARMSGLVHSAPVHNAHEIRKSNQQRALLFFLSPVHATRSHPGQRPTSRLQISRLARLCRGPVILLGGMDAKRFRSYAGQAHGWAAIDALSST